jgi:sulfur carrier protein
MSYSLRINGEVRQVAAASFRELLLAEGLDPEARGLAVAVNGAVLPRLRWADTAPGEGDEIEIVKPAAGG